MSAGKGDKPRPVDKKIFDKNFDSINWRAKSTESTMKKVKDKKTRIVYK